MKNVILFLAILLFPLLIASCKTEQKQPPIVRESNLESFWNSLDDSSKTAIKSIVMREANLLVPLDSIKEEMRKNEITATEAKQYTDNYYNSLPAAKRDSATKSVYFSLAQIQAIYDQILEYCPYPSNNPGIRIYFAKNSADQTTLSGVQKVILRATCNYDDLSHFDENNIERTVAWNYGDPCPPRCKPDLDVTTFCTGGEYNLRGPFRAENCPD